MILSLFAGLFEYLGLILIFQFVLFLSNPNANHCTKIIEFFKNNLNIQDFQQISLILGISIASIYILKNIYMLFFTKINNFILEDLSVNITTKIIKNLLLGDFLTVQSLKPEDNLDIIQKVNLVIWQYCAKSINFVVNCAIIIILLLFLFYKYFSIAFAATIFISALSLVEYLCLKKKSRYQNENYSKTLNNVNTNILTIINSIKEIKLNNKEETYINKSKHNFKEFSKLNKERSFNDVFHIYFTEITVMCAFILVLILLFLNNNFDNQILITSISTICAIILRITPAINRAQSCLYSINANKKPLEELIEFDKKFDNYNFIQTKDKLNFNDSIKLQNISFSYKNKEGLKNISLKINKNEFIAIVGENGSYKTTLSLILAGLIKPNKGKVLIDDKTLKDYKKWQNNFSILSQDFEVLEEFEKISQMSIGQKQKYAFLKLLNEDKNILILDEITSSLDVLVQEEINDILSEYKNKKTIIMIAHRFQMLKNCDKIIYLKNGNLIDFDTFSNLKNKYSDFQKMVELSEKTVEN